MGEEQQKKQYVDEVVNYIKDSCWTEKYILDPPKNIIAFKNCLYDIDKEEIIDFSEKYFITIKIPIEITSEYTDSEKIDQFFEDIVGKERKEILYELMAYCLLRDYPFQKFFILYGSGENGKTAFLNLVRKFFGTENVASETPQHLVSRNFSKANLWNKLVNISSDIPYIAIENTNVLKELVGGDWTNCERKFKTAFPFKNYAKLIFSANELPQINDKTYAFYRRVYILLFEKKIEKPDPFIIEKITTDKELSGLGWILIKKLIELKKRDFVFSHNPTVKKMEEMYEDLSNPLNKFLRTTTEIDEHEKIVKYEFRDRFSNWLRENGFRIWKDRDISIKMRELFQESRVAIHKVYDKELKQFVTKHYRAWEGLKWKK